MMALPGRVTVATARLVALLELAEWGARSEADRLLVAEVRNDVQRLGQKYMAAQAAAKRGNEDAGDHSGLDGGAEGAESLGEGGGDGGGAGAESSGAGGGVG